MAEGRMEVEWGQTASLLSLIANTNRDDKKQPRPFTPEDFMPQLIRKRFKKAAKKMGTIDDLKLLLNMKAGG